MGENNEEKKEGKKKRYICKRCGYIYEGDELPEGYYCPLCGDPSTPPHFELIEE